jgi:hypothetical protein
MDMTWEKTDTNNTGNVNDMGTYVNGNKHVEVHKRDM